MMLYLLGTLPSMIATGMNPFINAQGYSTTGMFSVAIGAIANILLDPLFIFTFHLGVNGAAAATVLSQILSALFVFHFLRRKAEIKVNDNSVYFMDYLLLQLVEAALHPALFPKPDRA